MISVAEQDSNEPLDFYFKKAYIDSMNNVNFKSGSKGGMKPGDTGPAPYKPGDTGPILENRPTVPGGGWDRMPFLQ